MKKLRKYSPKRNTSTSNTRVLYAVSNRGYKTTQIRYIVVHSTGTKPDMLLSELDNLPYNYLITKNGKLLNLKPVNSTDGTIEVALVGGLDKFGNRVDCRTDRQNEKLFEKLVKLSERYPTAKIVSADKLYVYAYANPGFNLQQWLVDYVPEFLRAA